MDQDGNAAQRVSGRATVLVGGSLRILWKRERLF